MTDDELQPLVAAELDGLAALLESLPEAAWDTASMCTGWRVREVIAHLTMAARYSTEEFEAMLRDAAFDFTAVSDRVAARDATLPRTTLLANLRSGTMRRWAPPGGGFAGALNHVVVHGLDVTAPLRAERVTPDQTMRIILDGLTAPGVHQRFGTSADGLALTATDIAWSFGSGTPVRAPAQDLVLALCGRRVAGLELPKLRDPA
ncbi:MAG: maleylpyruvate isomerase family mycothiol-dependent enzyme [Acidimicrobiales bacterium]|nr:maleylpyruvate isomerase family mycothiol-dependent enzyme [Acidimicrobiales bacterium]